jgi:hypothetical protein
MITSQHLHHNKPLLNYGLVRRFRDSLYSCPRPCPCYMPMSNLHVCVIATCLCPICMSVSMLHAHVHAACPGLCCVSMSRLHSPAHAACSYPCCMSILSRRLLTQLEIIGHVYPLCVYDRNRPLAPILRQRWCSLLYDVY